MKREFRRNDIPNIENGNLKLLNVFDDEVRVVTWNNNTGDERIKIIVTDKENLPVGYDSNGFCYDECCGEYFGTSLYVEDGKDIRNIPNDELLSLIKKRK